MEQYKLGEKRLKSLGIEVSKLREKLRELALHHDKGVAFVEGKDIHDVSRLAMRIRRMSTTTEPKERYFCALISQMMYPLVLAENLRKEVLSRSMIG